MDSIVNTVHEFNFFFLFFFISVRLTGRLDGVTIPLFPPKKTNAASFELSDNLLFADLNGSKENWTDYPLMSTLLFYSHTCAYLQSPSKSPSQFNR